ncbi:hypothetical protein BCEN4_740152 [Burkholderia cenocepacia]|nr:hypothetical protein BCEN4_740152 [Burkholderia cenocepacia]
MQPFLTPMTSRKLTLPSSQHKTLSTQLKMRLTNKQHKLSDETRNPKDKTKGLFYCLLKFLLIYPRNDIDKIGL